MSNSTAITQIVVPSEYNLFGYTPNAAAAYVCVALYAIPFIAISALNIKFKSWFMIPVCIGCLMEIIGFAIRPTSAYSVSQYVLTVLMVLLAPTIYAMSDYSFLSKM